MSKAGRKRASKPAARPADPAATLRAVQSRLASLAEAGALSAFIVRLIDVYPDGAAYNLTEGVIRARFREDIRGEPRLLEPGRVYEFPIDMMVTSNVFLRGHRIRVHVTSSSFPQWDRNPNTGHVQGMDAEVRPARQTIYHDRERPSHIVLPVVPNP